MKENNQLKADCNKANMELEKLESRFTMQVDEYELEIENLSNKLKEKENTVKVLLSKSCLPNRKNRSLSYYDLNLNINNYKISTHYRISNTIKPKISCYLKIFYSYYD